MPMYSTNTALAFAGAEVNVSVVPFTLKLPFAASLSSSLKFVAT